MVSTNNVSVNCNFFFNITCRYISSKKEEAQDRKRQEQQGGKGDGQWEEERWKKEADLDEKRRKEEREHEMRLFQMLAQMAKPNPYPSTAV